MSEKVWSDVGDIETELALEKTKVNILTIALLYYAQDTFHPQVSNTALIALAKIRELEKLK